MNKNINNFTIVSLPHHDLVFTAGFEGVRAEIFNLFEIRRIVANLSIEALQWNFRNFFCSILGIIRCFEVAYLKVIVNVGLYLFRLGLRLLLSLFCL